MPLSKYRLSTEFPGSAQAPMVGCGKLGCPEESFLINSSLSASKLIVFLGWAGGVSYFVTVFNQYISPRASNH